MNTLFFWLTYSSHLAPYVWVSFRLVLFDPYPAGWKITFCLGSSAISSTWRRKFRIAQAAQLGLCTLHQTLRGKRKGGAVLADSEDLMPRSMQTPTASEAVLRTQLKLHSQPQWCLPSASRVEPVNAQTAWFQRRTLTSSTKH